MGSLDDDPPIVWGVVGVVPEVPLPRLGDDAWARVFFGELRTVASRSGAID